MPIKQFLLRLTLIAGILPLIAILISNRAYASSYLVYAGIAGMIGVYVKTLDLAISVPIFFVFLLGYFQRYLFLIIFPEYSDFTVFQSRNTFESAEITTAFLFMLLCLISMYVGIRLHKTFANGQPVPLQSMKAHSPIKAFIFYTCFSSALTMYLLIVESVGIQGGEDSSLGFLTRIFDMEASIFALMFILVACHKELTKQQRNITLILLASYACFSVARGGRSGLIYIAIVLLFAAVVANRMHFIKVRYVVYTIAGLFILGPIYFNLGFIIRMYWLEDINLSFSDLTSATPDAFNFLLNNISNRLGELDHLVAIVNHFELNDYSTADRFFPVIQNTLKGFLPGLIFTTDTVSLDRMFTYSFRDIPLTVQHAEHWGGFGAGYGYFGYAGALVYFFLFGWVFSAIVHRFRRYPSDSIMALIFTSILYCFYSNLYTAYWELLLAGLGRFIIIVCLIVAAHKFMQMMFATENRPVLDGRQS